MLQLVDFNNVVIPEEKYYHCYVHNIFIIISQQILCDRFITCYY